MCACTPPSFSHKELAVKLDQPSGKAAGKPLCVGNLGLGRELGTDMRGYKEELRQVAAGASLTPLCRGPHCLSGPGSNHGRAGEQAPAGGQGSKSPAKWSLLRTG